MYYKISIYIYLVLEVYKIVNIIHEKGRCSVNDLQNGINYINIQELI